MSRLDKLLVELNIIPTRTKAQELIKNGNVKVNGEVIIKPSLEFSVNDTFEIIDNTTLKYVSRAGLKLEKAVNEFNIDLNNKKIMDIGSSTGGFTDCALQNGAKKVVAVDVGTNLMHISLRTHPKVELYEQTNIKDLPHDKFIDIDYFTVDVSFISLTKIFEKLANENIKTDVIALIKPQFECGKTIADKFRGIILNQKIHNEILHNVITKINQLGFYLNDITFSPITGGDGNIEYISHFTNKTTINSTTKFKDVISLAFNSLKNK